MSEADPVTGETIARGESPSTIKITLILLFIIAAIPLEIYGFKHGYLRYFAIDFVIIVGMVGLNDFVNSYNKIVFAKDRQREVKRLKFSAEILACIGVVSLTLGVAIGLYNLDATNSEANFSKLLSVQRQMLPKAKLLGCEISSKDTGQCKAFHDSLNKLWEAVFASDVKGMASGVDNVRIQWELLGIKWPYQSHGGFIATTQDLDKLKYWSDTTKQQFAFVLAMMLLPFSLAATSRKLAVAAFDARSSDDPLRWRLVAKYAARAAWRKLVRLGRRDR